MTLRHSEFDATFKAHNAANAALSAVGFDGEDPAPLIQLLMEVGDVIMASGRTPGEVRNLFCGVGETILQRAS